MGISLAWNIYHDEAQLMDQARAEAKANFDKDITFRRWVTMHGGVYVPVTPEQQPIPWLKHLPDRDVVTRDGKLLTLLNPATMLRQMMDRYGNAYGIKGRITGLKYLNPANAPDSWEREQLLAFQRGERKESWAVSDIDGRSYLRYFQAVYMEPGCIKCHAVLGYTRVGELRGGIGVNLPLAHYHNLHSTNVLGFSTGHVLIWLMGLIGITWAGRQQDLRARELERAVAALRASEKRFDLAVNGAEEGVWDLEVATGKMYRSKRMCEMLGFTEEELFPSLNTWKSLMHPDDRDAVLAALQSHIEGKTPRFEAVFRAVHKDGSYRWILSRGRAIHDASGRTVRVVGVHSDITERKAMEAQLFEEKERAQVTLASIGDAVLTTDAEGFVTFMNGVAERLTGWKLAEALKAPVETVVSLLDEETRQSMPHPVERCRAGAQIVELAGNTLLINRDGHEISIQDSAAPILNREGQLIGVVMVFRDVSESREMARQMSWQIAHDALTGLVSRREFERRLGLLVEDAHHSGQQHALLYLDLDNFKIVNDVCGHLAGDELLKQLASQMSARMRRNDTLARLGGDEFAALLENCPVEIALEIANKLRLTVAAFHFEWDNKTLEVGVSIGVVVVNADTASMVDALSAADVACYAAKEGGRNRVQLYTNADPASVSKHLDLHLAADIRSAVSVGRFELYAQEILSLQNKPGRYFEVLVRMVDSYGKLIQPGLFITTAERYGLMPEIDLWVVKQALALLAQAGSGAQDVRLAINLSGLCFGDLAMSERVRELVVQSEVDPARITFEITETAAVTLLSHAARVMRELGSLGCRFALDDFGSGMSSFAYLKALPVNTLKIDGAFVREMLASPTDKAFVEAIHHVAHTLGMETVAEFAESQEIVEALRAIGIDYAQGYAVAKPRQLEAVLRGE